jgi:hypothetical protein
MIIIAIDTTDALSVLSFSLKDIPLESLEHPVVISFHFLFYVVFF